MIDIYRDHTKLPNPIDDIETILEILKNMRTDIQ